MNQDAHKPSTMTFEGELELKQEVATLRLRINNLETHIACDETTKEELRSQITTLTAGSATTHALLEATKDCCCECSAEGCDGTSRYCFCHAEKGRK